MKAYLHHFSTEWHNKPVSPLTLASLTMFQGAMSILMLVSNNIFALINYLSFVQWLSVGASVLGMVYLRFKKPDMPRPIKVRD